MIAFWMRVPYFLAAAVLWLSLAPGVYAQSQPNPSRPAVTRTPDGNKLFSLEGIVVLGKDGSGLDRARVSLIDFNGRSVGFTMTNEEGMFIFYELPAGSYTLNVNHPQTGDHSERVDLTVASLRGMRVVVGDSLRVGTSTTGATLPLWAQKIPDDARKEYDAGLSEMKAGDWKKCSEHMKAALVLYPDYASAYSALATAHLRMEHRKAAIDAYANALKIDDNLVDANMALGAIYSADKQYPEAEKLLLRANLVKSDDWRILFELGQLYWRMEKPASAEAHLTKAKTLHPELARTYLLLMNVLAIQDKLPESLAVMEEYLKRFPTDPFAGQVKQKRDQLKAHLAANPAPQPKP